MGVYFVVIGLESAVEPAVRMLFMTEAWVARFGNFAAAAVWLAGDVVLVRCPQTVLKVLTRYRAA